MKHQSDYPRWMMLPFRPGYAVSRDGQINMKTEPTHQGQGSAPTPPGSKSARGVTSKTWPGGDPRRAIDAVVEEVVQELTTLYRVQDAEGRGPYRPGFSHAWVDAVRAEYPPTIFDDFGPVLLAEAKRSGLHLGCAFRTPEQLHRWFTRRELTRLENAGYAVVAVQADRVFAESEWQVLFGCEAPLSRRVHPAE